ncbi:hypothetical protein Ddc_15755 [Ditylenchus destructor]|nr:hypothetical protein Ddc_15755 [Ditylenchus destructor]
MAVFPRAHLAPNACAASLSLFPLYKESASWPDCECMLMETEKRESPIPPYPSHPIRIKLDAEDKGDGISPVAIWVGACPQTLHSWAWLRS